MNYKIQGEWLNIMIDDTFPFQTLQELFDYFKISAKERYLMVQNNEVMVNHLPLKDVKKKLARKQILRLKAFKKGHIDYRPELCFDLEIVFEDAFCLIVNKPSGYIVHEDDKQKGGTLCNVVASYYQKKKIHQPVRFIHRLDKETSGLIFFCKSSFFLPYYNHLLEKKEISRQYLARVSGIVPWSTFTLEAPIGKNRHLNNCYGVYPSGKYAKTTFDKLKTFTDETLLLCTLSTGRTHQIRVHLAHLGFPIINDALYGKIKDERHMGLCAVYLQWRHPLTNELLSCHLEKTDWLKQ